MKPLLSQYCIALCGLGPILENGIAKTRTLNGWTHWAKQEADRRSKATGVKWTAFVAWIEWQNAYRISFASQPY